VRETLRPRAPLQGSGPYSAYGIGERHTPDLPGPVRCAFRVSTLLTPCSPRDLAAMFQTATLLGFALRRFPLPRHGSGLSAHPARLALARTDPPTRVVQILARLPGFALRGSPLSPASRRSGRTRASLGLSIPSRGTLSPRRPRTRRDLLPRAWTRIACKHAARNRPLGVSIAESLEVLRREPLPLLGFLHLVPASRVSVPNRSQLRFSPAR
jgi:hypothetical protein